jgi:hypothetical protein
MASDDEDQVDEGEIDDEEVVVLELDSGMMIALSSSMMRMARGIGGVLGVKKTSVGGMLLKLWRI